MTCLSSKVTRIDHDGIINEDQYEGDTEEDQYCAMFDDCEADELDFFKRDYPHADIENLDYTIVCTGYTERITKKMAKEIPNLVYIGDYEYHGSNDIVSHTRTFNCTDEQLKLLTTGALVKSEWNGSICVGRSDDGGSAMHPVQLVQILENFNYCACVDTKNIVGVSIIHFNGWNICYVVVDSESG